MRILIVLGAAILLFGVICLASLIDCNHRFVVRRYPYHTNKTNRRLTLVFISDLHNKVYGDGNEAIYNAIREIGPDAILIGGDMTIAKPAIRGAFAGDLTGMDEALRFLRNLPAIAPTWFVNGNHEQRIYETGQRADGIASADRRGRVEEIDPSRIPIYRNVQTMSRTFYERLEDYGIRQLHNTNATLPVEPNIVLYGYEHACAHYEKLFSNPIPDGDVADKVGTPDPASLNILIAHNPKFLRTYAQWGADLVLSGHVHGGLMRIGRLGFIGPDLHLFPQYSGGVYYVRRGSGERDGRSDCANDLTEMILSCGLGAHTLPIRIFNPGEISVVDIIPENE